MSVGAAYSLSSSVSVRAQPADVEILSVSRYIPTIIAYANISNKGAAGSDFEYQYCITFTQEDDCGGLNDVDYKSGTRYIGAGDSWLPELGLELGSPGLYWYEVRARALGGAAWAKAEHQFRAVMREGGGGGTGGAAYEYLEKTGLIPCGNNTDCPIGYYCENDQCTGLDCEQLTPDGHGCAIMEKKPDYYYLLSIILLIILIIMYYGREVRRRGRKNY